MMPRTPAKPHPPVGRDDNVVTQSTKSRGPDRVDVMASVDDLAAVPLFSSFDEGQLAKLASWFHVQNANEGARLVGEGAPGYTFFVRAGQIAELA